MPTHRLMQLCSTSLALATALLTTAILPQTQVFFHPASLPYTKAKQLYTSWKTCSPLAAYSCPCCRNQRPNPQQTRGAAPPGFAPSPRKPCLLRGGGSHPGSPTCWRAPTGSSPLSRLPPAPAVHCAAGCFTSSCPQRPHNSCGLNYQNNILIVS